MIETILGLLFSFGVIFVIGFIHTRFQNNRALRSCNAHCILNKREVVFCHGDLLEIRRALPYFVTLHGKENISIKACKIERNNIVGEEKITYLHEKITML